MKGFFSSKRAPHFHFQAKRPEIWNRGCLATDAQMLFFMFWTLALEMI